MYQYIANLFFEHSFAKHRYTLASYLRYQLQNFKRLANLSLYQLSK